MNTSRFKHRQRAALRRIAFSPVLRKAGDLASALFDTQVRMVAQAIAYTHAYSTFAIRSCLNPELPNNFGNLAPIIAKASGGCVNCKYPTPVNARHIVGMYVPMPILKALYHVIPDRVLAEGAGAVWTIQVRGKNLDGSTFISVDIPLLRRHGRAAQQGRPERDLLPHRRCRRAG